MSQFPPPPPPGQPAFPPGGYGQPMPGVRTTSGAAITSLVCGLLFCIPGVTGLVAVITGIVGIKSTSKPNVGGRGMAIAGLLLGLLSIAGWIGVGGVMWYGWSVVKEQMKSAEYFTAAVTAGDYEKAAQYTTSNFSADEIKSLGEDMKDWGSLTNMQLSGTKGSKTLGGASVTITGTATFSKAGQKNFEVTLVQEGDKLKIGGIKFE